MNENGEKNENESSEITGNFVVVSYDLDTTGRRLIDEIVQIGAQAIKKVPNGEPEICSYSQYIMPHRNPKPAARRAYGFAVANIGRSRMLKDIHTGEILKTKSEITALQGFMAWLEGVKADSDGIVLVFHEQNPKVLVPLLIQSLARYNLVQPFKKVVKGFCNSASVIDKIGNKAEITSLSLRSLCKTVLHNTSLPTTTANDRCKRVIEILSSVTQKKEKIKQEEMKKDVLPLEIAEVLSLEAAVRPFVTTIQAEEENLNKLQHIESIQLTLRPIFAELLGGSWQVRERMVRIRRALAENLLDYSKLKVVAKVGELKEQVAGLDLQETDKEELTAILNHHFAQEVEKADKSVAIKRESQAAEE